jgi:S-DNA-T family DNA segregation ATPase FtsK/SpoIIIE
MSSSWPLLQVIKSARHGIALQPDQLDGDTIFKTSFPRMARSESPTGRGMYVRAGRITRVQCALPELDS